MAYSISLSFRCCSATGSSRKANVPSAAAGFEAIFWLNTPPERMRLSFQLCRRLLGFGLRRSPLATTHDVPQVLRATMVT
jgi:hypothetical protein